MACRLDIQKAILDQAFKEMFEGRYTFTRLSDDTVRVNNRVDAAKTKAMSSVQAERIAHNRLDAVKRSFNNKIGGYVTQVSPYDPITITLSVSPDYIEYEYQNLSPEQKTDPADENMLQTTTPSTVTSKASPATVKLAKDFLNRIGVNVQGVNQIVVNGVKLDANAVALLTQKLVQVVNGMEDVALTEEAMHFAVEILEQKDPALFTKLLGEVNEYRMYKDVFAEYSQLPQYKDDFGRPNIRKIKKEAIAKILTETIINKNEGSTEKPENLAKVENWWTRIINAIKSIFQKSGFDVAAMKVLSGEVEGTIDDIRAQEGDLFLQVNNQEVIYNKLKDIQATIVKKDDGYYIDDKKVPNRVTDIVKSWYERRFAANEIAKSDFQRAVDDLKAEKGTAGHADIEYAFSLFVDNDGYLRPQPLDDSGYVSQLDPNNRDMYELLRDNLKERLNSFPKENGGTRFMSEVMIYDPKRALAGTVDFLAITPDGKMNILDWKFTDLNLDKTKDIPWYKVNAWRQQMDQYKIILQNVYGVKPGNFEQSRMIPIRAIYSQAIPKAGALPKLLSVEIGDVNVQNIKEDYLIPVGVEGEKTGNKKIDALIEKLNAVYKQLSEKKALPSEKLDKREQLNALFTAIRQLQMKQNLTPLLYQAKILNKQIRSTIDKYNNEFKGKDPKSFSEEERDAFADEIINAQNALSTYVNLDTDLRFLFQGKELSTEEKKLRDELRDTADDARDLDATLVEISNDFVDEFVAGSEDVKNILSPEKIIKGMTKWFASTSTLQLKAVQTLFKKANKAFGLASMDTITETRKLEGLKAAYDKLAQAKGLGVKDYFNLIKKANKNELIDEFNPEFYKTLRAKAVGKDLEWIKDNVDVQSFIDASKQKLEDEITRIKDKPRILTQEEEDALQQGELPADVKREIFQVTKLYNTSTSDGAGWYNYDLLKKFPNKDKWESKEWKELHKSENKAALDFYNYIKERNEYYREIGYISAPEARTFLPYIRKGLMEKIIFGGKISLGEQFLKNISIEEGEAGYGQIDPLTGRPIDKIPIYFTKEIEGEVSTDLFRTMALYNEMAIKYKYLTDIEAQARLLVNTERNKKAIATSLFGKTQYKDGKLQYTPDNNENTELVEKMVKGIIYGQKYIESESFDQLLGKLGNFGERANKKMGINIFPENLSGRQVSVNKVITQMNSVFQLNALGLNVLSATSNLFGGTAQSIINSGKYFTKADYATAELWLLGNKMGGKDQKKAIAALEYFMPLTDNYNKEIAKKLSLSKLSQENIQEFLMVLMRNSDKAVQTANFYSFLNNTIVQDGEIVNAREYLRSTDEYKDMYAGTKEQRQAREAKFEKDAKALVEDKGVMKLATIENNELVIPGVDRKSNSVLELRRKVQSLTKDALGNLSEDDIRLINLSIYGKSFMMFKNWIPRLADVRFGNLKYNAASDAYEWGRARMVFRMLSEDTLGSLKALGNSLIGNDEKTIDQLRGLYEKKKQDYETETGKELEMTESEFIDLGKKNVKGQLLDAIFLLTLVSLVAGLKANAPDDDEDPRVKNQYKFLMKGADKLRDELSYFYDPTSIAGLVSKGIFPSMGLLENFSKVFKNFLLENYYIVTGQEEKAEKNFVLKYVMSSFPMANQAKSWLPMFYPDVAKDLGIKAQSQSGIR